MDTESNLSGGKRKAGFLTMHLSEWDFLTIEICVLAIKVGTGGIKQMVLVGTFSIETAIDKRTPSNVLCLKKRAVCLKIIDHFAGHMKVI